jgi:hypothetical protein
MIDEKSIVIVELEDKLVDFVIDYENVIEKVAKSRNDLATMDMRSKQIDSKRDLKCWKKSTGNFSLNPRRFNFGLKDL